MEAWSSAQLGGQETSCGMMRKDGSSPASSEEYSDERKGRDEFFKECKMKKCACRRGDHILEIIFYVDGIQTMEIQVETSVHSSK